MRYKLFFASVLSAFIMVNTAYAGHHEESGEKHKGKHEKFAKFDKNGDKRFSKSEYLDMKSAHFDKLDADGDGYLTRDEMKSARKAAKERYKKMKDKKQSQEKSEE